MLLVIGAAGARKTTLVLQTAFRAAAHGRNVVFVSTYSERPDRLLGHARSLGFYDESRVGTRITLSSLYPLVKKGLDGVADALVNAVREKQAALLVIDGLMTLRDLHPDTPELRSFIYELSGVLVALDCTTLITSSAAGPAEQREYPDLTMVDGVVDLGRQQIGNQTVRTLRVQKMRGQTPLLGTHALRVDRRKDRVPAAPPPSPRGTGV